LTFIFVCIILLGKIGKEGILIMAILNIKNFPDDVHRKAKAEAALMGISLKAFIIKAIEEYLKKKERR
jgi:hypothetical protein